MTYWQIVSDLMVTIDKSNGQTTLGINLRQEADQSYPIIIENGLLSKIPADIKERKLGDRFAIITDTNVSPIYGTALKNGLIDEGFAAKRIVFPAGEQSKGFEVLEYLVNELSASGFGRDTTIIALGGGVVGDLAGFVAAGFNRGVRLIQVPTTLVAQADSSVGGKTGIDTKYGKNLFGAIKQPEIVYIDPLALKTLPPKQYSCGLAETVKHAIVWDATFFSYLEKNTADILRMRDEALFNLAETNCKIKGAVVEIDPNENGLRRILNLGHTIGHAVEMLSDYRFLHGYCVAMGMIPALKIANKITKFPPEEITRVEKLLNKFHLPTEIPLTIKTEDIIRATALDKKATEGQARYCLPIKIGKMAKFENQYVTPVDNNVVKQVLTLLRNKRAPKFLDE